jgi:hypothetical protein
MVMGFAQGLMLMSVIALHAELSAKKAQHHRHQSGVVVECR